MNEMWMRPSMTGTLCKRQMLMIVCIVNSLCRKSLNWFRKELCKIRTFNFLWDFGFRPFSRVHYQWFPFNQRPLYSFFGAIDFKTFAILPGNIKERAIYMCTQIGISELNMRSFYRKWR